MKCICFITTRTVHIKYLCTPLEKIQAGQQWQAWAGYPQRSSWRAATAPDTTLNPRSDAYYIIGKQQWKKAYPDIDIIYGLFSLSVGICSQALWILDTRWLRASAESLWTHTTKLNLTPLTVFSTNNFVLKNTAFSLNSWLSENWTNSSKILFEVYRHLTLIQIQRDCLKLFRRILA